MCSKRKPPFIVASSGGCSVIGTWLPRVHFPPGSSLPLNCAARRNVWSMTTIVATTPPVETNGRMLVAHRLSCPSACAIGVHCPSPASAGEITGVSGAGAWPALAPGPVAPVAVGAGSLVSGPVVSGPVVCGPVVVVSPGGVVDAVGTASDRSLAGFFDGGVRYAIASILSITGLNPWFRPHVATRDENVSPLSGMAYFARLTPFQMPTVSSTAMTADHSGVRFHSRFADRSSTPAVTSAAAIARPQPPVMMPR